MGQNVHCSIACAGRVFPRPVLAGGRPAHSLEIMLMRTPYGFAMAASVSPSARPLATSARSLVLDDGRGHQTNRHGNRHPSSEEVKLRIHVYQGPILGSQE